MCLVNETSAEEVSVTYVNPKDLDQLEEWMKEKPIPYISNDKFSQEGIFQYWAGCPSGHTHVNQVYPDVVRMWRQTVPWLSCIWRWDRTSLFFSWKTAKYSQEKNNGQDPGKHIEGINQYEIADL